MPLEITLNNEQQVKVTVAPKTSKGKPASIDGAASFTSADEGDNLVTIQVLDDNSALLITPGGFSGDRTIIVSADADLGTGVVTVEDTIILHISNPQAVNLGLTNTAPEDKPV